MNDRIIVKTIAYDNWVSVEWAASNVDTGGDDANTLASIDLDGDGNMYLRFHNDADDPFILVLDTKGLRIYESEDLPPNMDPKYGDKIAWNAETHNERALCASSGTRVHELGADDRCVFCEAPLVILAVPS